MRKIRKILVPLDRSAGSEAVLPAVAELARGAEGAEVCLLHVARPVEAVIQGDLVVAYADQETARVEQEVLAYLKKVADNLSEIEAECVVRFGDPVKEIVREAESAGADLVAMATHRRSGLGRLLIGSVAEKVERTTTIPVLLVRYGERLAA